MCVEYNCWKLSPAFRKIIRLEKTLYECFSWFFPGSGSLRDHHCCPLVVVLPPVLVVP